MAKGICSYCPSRAPKGRVAAALRRSHITGAMWDEPYLESCCRSALHRLMLCGEAGRPPGLKDGPCLERLAGMALVRARTDGRYEITDAGAGRHAREVLRRPTA